MQTQITLPRLHQQLSEVIQENTYMGLDASQLLVKSRTKSLRFYEVFNRATVEIERSLQAAPTSPVDNIRHLRLIQRDGEQFYQRYTVHTNTWSRWFLKALVYITPEFMKRFLPRAFSNTMGQAERETRQSYDTFQTFLHQNIHRLSALAPTQVNHESSAPLRETIYVATDGLSQHSPIYRSIVGHKQNSNGTREPVYFASASCTPMAIAFAATAREANENRAYATETTPKDHLDAVLGNQSKVAKGIRALQMMIDDPQSDVTLENMNLGADQGVGVYEEMNNFSRLVRKRNYNGDNNAYYHFNESTGESGMENSPDWYKTVLGDLAPGEGALIIFGGYSIGLRRIRDTYEIFDSHNSSSYTGRQGASVISCPNRALLEANLDRIRGAGSAAAGGDVEAAAQGIEISVF